MAEFGGVVASHTNSERELLTIERANSEAFAGQFLLVIHDDPPLAVKAPMLLDEGTQQFLRTFLDSIARDESGMSTEERRAFREEGIVPVGWYWCPDCNGEGRVTSMSVSYPHDETTYDCETCATEHGIVPDA